MIQEEENKTQEGYAVRPRHHHRRIEYSDHDNLFKVRNILNIAFMILAVIGLILWYKTDYSTVAGIFLLIGVVLKIAEVCIRMFRK